MNPTYEIITGDALKVLPTLNGIDVVVTDPPYGLEYPYASYVDTAANTNYLISKFVPLCIAAAKRTIIFPGIHNLWTYPRADWVCSWSWRSTSHFGKAGFSMWQPILMYGKDVDGFGSVDGVLKNDSFHFPDGNGIGFLGEKKADHPCPKPERVMRLLVKRFCPYGGTVLDPFCGSGTTGVACLQTGRNFIGIEIDPKYADIARARCAAEAAQGKLFAGGEA